MEVIEKNSFKLSKPNYKRWKKFWKGEIVFVDYEEVLSKYLFYYDEKVWYGVYKIHENPVYTWSDQNNVMSILLQDNTCDIEVEGGTDAKMENVIGKEISGEDGVYWFKNKRSCKWESIFTGETIKRKNLELGDTFMDYFTDLHNWEIKTM
jgi:hypothetical protein